MTPPRLLVDDEVLAGSAHALPLAWLDGFALMPYPVRHLATGPDAPFALVRSMTQVGPAALAALPSLRAVATLSSGVDHIDTAALAKAGVALATGRGGNARAVADWCDWALHRLWLRPPSPDSLQGLRVLVVGVGAVGSLVARLLLARGATVVLHDPPRAARSPAGPAELPGQRWADLDTALAAKVDAITLHVPLERGGRWPTEHWLGADRLRAFAERTAGLLVLQASRGGVLDEAAAEALRRAGKLGGLGIDTWRAEPTPAPSLLACADLATPHLAGHSAQGKLEVAARAVAQLRAWAGLDPAHDTASAAAARLGAAADADPWQALDAAASALQAQPKAFSALRHAHLRTESHDVACLPVVLPQ